MKNAIKIVGIIALLALPGLVFTGCDLEEYYFSFVNNSTYTIKITSSDLSPSSFNVYSGSSRTAASEKDTISFTHNYEVFVKYVQRGRNITFTNK